MCVRYYQRFSFGEGFANSSVFAGASFTSSSLSFIITSSACPTSSSRLSCSSLADFSASSSACSKGLPFAASASCKSVCVRVSFSSNSESHRSKPLLNRFSRRVTLPMSPVISISAVYVSLLRRAIPVPTVKPLLIFSSES